MTPRIEVPAAARWVVKTLEDAGFETWTVGGGVRDALLGAESVDWDFATAARPRDIQRVFRRTVPVGIDHGTIGVLDRDDVLHEVTTFRKDVETDGRHAVVTFADRIEDDLARRDFTINAIAWHPLRRELFDPFDGQRDLERRGLRTVGRPAERFAEDYLRILRGLRFAGRFDLEIAPETWEALVHAMEGLGGLSSERIREEWVKVMGAGDPSASLDLYRDAGALARVAPALGGVSDERWSAALERVARLDPRDPILRTVALFEVTLGEPPNGRPRPALATGVATWMQGLRYSNADTDRAVGLIAGPANLPEEGASDGEVRRWLAAVGPERIPDRLRLLEAAIESSPAEAASKLRAGLERARAVVASGPPLTVGDLAIGGRDLIRLGLKPGPHFGDLLHGALECVLEDPALNTTDALLEEVGRLRKAEAGRPDDPERPDQGTGS